MTSAYEVNFDGLVGPTHNFSGLSWGNEASFEYKMETSNPLQAFLQGLDKAKFMMDLGVKQAVLPPHERPHLPTLRQLGFTGTPEAILNDAKRYAPWVFRYTSSASAMWAANAATTTPSIDSIHKKMQITPANLHNKFHRSIEAETTGKILQSIFANPVFFDHHSPLPSHPLFSDEGAANHTRFGKNHFGPGVHLFVYGNSRITEDELVPRTYPARQSKQASQAIKELHKIYDKQVIFAQQNPKAIDQGVFHNDVISTGNLNLFLYHEEAFFDTPKVIAELREKLAAQADTDLIELKVPTEKISLEEAVKSYLFNSQIVSLPDGSMTLLAPSECSERPAVKAYLDEIAADSTNPIHAIHYINLRESMKNGGGPACLRLRIVLNEVEFPEMNQEVLLTDNLYRTLVAWGKKHYRDRLTPHDLTDVSLYQESQRALDELTGILKLGSIYSFQRG